MSIKAWLGGLLYRCDVEEKNGKAILVATPRLKFLPVIGPITIDRANTKAANGRTVDDGVETAFKQWMP